MYRAHRANRHGRARELAGLNIAEGSSVRLASLRLATGRDLEIVVGNLPGGKQADQDSYRARHVATALVAAAAALSNANAPPGNALVLAQLPPKNSGSAVQ